MNSSAGFEGESAIKCRVDKTPNDTQAVTKQTINGLNNSRFTASLHPGKYTQANHNRDNPFHISSQSQPKDQFPRHSRSWPAKPIHRQNSSAQILAVVTSQCRSQLADFLHQPHERSIDPSSLVLSRSTSCGSVAGSPTKKFLAGESVMGESLRKISRVYPSNKLLIHRSGGVEL